MALWESEGPGAACQLTDYDRRGQNRKRIKVMGRSSYGPFYHLRPDCLRTTDADDCEVNSPSLPLPVISRTNDPSQRTSERTTPSAISTPRPLPSPPPLLAPSSTPTRTRSTTTTACTKNLFTSLVRRSSELQIGKKMDDDGFEMQMSDSGVCLLAICESEPVSVDMWNLGRHVCGLWGQGSAVDSSIYQLVLRELLFNSYRADFKWLQVA